MQGCFSSCLAGTAVAFVLFFGTASGASAQSAYPVAGVNPDKRPEGAPVIRYMTKNADWYSGALAGVSKPYPKSLWFLDNQGAWFNPFLRPGMTDLYDIRGHHKK